MFQVLQKKGEKVGYKLRKNAIKSGGTDFWGTLRNPGINQNHLNPREFCLAYHDQFAP